MAENTGIQWTNDTWNPLRATFDGARLGWACVKVSEGCQHCYAEEVNHRFGNGLDYTVPNTAKVEHVISERQMSIALKRQGSRRVFISSMTDVFGEWVTDEQLDRIFGVMAATPQHTYQVLTKRHERMREYLSKRPVLDNVWAGMSVENQRRAEERVPVLHVTPAAVRFLSVEPQVEAIDLNGMLDGIGWVICGGESGRQARPFDLSWARALRDQCADAGVAFFLKQLGEAHSKANHFTDRHAGDETEWPADLQGLRAFPPPSSVAPASEGGGR